MEEPTYHFWILKSVQISLLLENLNTFIYHKIELIANNLNEKDINIDIKIIEYQIEYMNEYLLTFAKFLFLFSTTQTISE
mgnify:CR=1 FL=1